MREGAGNGSDFLEVTHSFTESSLSGTGSKVFEDAVPKLIGILSDNGIDPEAAAKVLEQIVPIIQEVLRRDSISYKIEQGVKEFKDLTIKTVKDAKDFAAAKIEGGIAICQNSFDKTIEFGSKLIDEIKEFMPVMKEALEKAFESMMSKANSVVKATEKFIDSAKEVFNKMYKDISESVTKFIKDVVSSVQALSEEVTRHTKTAIKVGKEFLDNAKKTVEEISTSAKAGLVAAGSAAYEAGKAGLDKASNAASYAASKTGEGAYEAKGGIMSKVSSIAQSIAAGAQSIADSAQESSVKSKGIAANFRTDRESNSKGRG
jgi:ElaB/YqjD/DUF883 family membrane-anchored ribosome-binding protein